MLKKNITSLIEYQWRENDHFTGPKPDLNLGWRVYRYISSEKD